MYSGIIYFLKRWIQNRILLLYASMKEYFTSKNILYNVDENTIIRTVSSAQKKKKILEKQSGVYAEAECSLPRAFSERCCLTSEMVCLNDAC